MLVQKWLFCCHVATYKLEAFISAASRMFAFFLLLALLDVALAAQQ